MPSLLEIKQDNVVMLAKPKAVKNTARKNDVPKLTCFIDIIDFLMPTPKNAKLNTTAVRDIITQVEQKSEQYKMCAYILTQIPQDGLVGSADVSDLKLNNWLKKNIEDNYERQKTAFIKEFKCELNDTSITEYTQLFLNYCKREYGLSHNTSLVNWLTYTRKFYDSVTALTLGNASLSLLTENGYTEQEIIGDDSQMSAIEKASLSFSFLQKTLATTCGFVVDNTAWNPQSPIDIFLSVLQKKGFLIIGGWLGTPCYKKEPSPKWLMALKYMPGKKEILMKTKER